MNTNGDRLEIYVDSQENQHYSSHITMTKMMMMMIIIIISILAAATAGYHRTLRFMRDSTLQSEESKMLYLYIF